MVFIIDIILITLIAKICVRFGSFGLFTPSLCGWNCICGSLQSRNRKVPFLFVEFYQGTRYMDTKEPRPNKEVQSVVVVVVIVVVVGSSRLGGPRTTD